MCLSALLMMGGLLGALVVSPDVALAQPPAAPATEPPQSAAVPAAITAEAPVRDPAAGETLFREGRRLLKAGDVTAACAKFTESQRLDPAPGTLANVADCEEQAGRTATAWVLWRRVVDETASTDPRQSTARKRADALEKRLPRLSIRTGDKAPSALVIKRDGVVIGAASLGVALPVDPGIHVVTTSAVGHHDAQFVIDSREGEEKVLEVTAGAPVPVATPVPPTIAMDNESAPSPIPPVPAGAPPSKARRSIGYALTAAGIAAAGAGGFFALRARQARNEASAFCGGNAAPPLCWGSAKPALDRDARNSQLADIGLATSAIVSAVGVYLILTHGNETERAAKPQGTGSGLAFGAGPVLGGAEVQVATTF
jgi:hypothetical protein